MMNCQSLPVSLPSRWSNQEQTLTEARKLVKFLSHKHEDLSLRGSGGDDGD